MIKFRKPTASDILPFIILIIFLIGALLMWIKTKRSFFLFDLPYIGLSLFAGLILARILPKEKKQFARKIPQFLIGFYFLFFLSFVMKTNMQIEGFFLLFFAGIFTGATLHYTIAKIFGPLIFNRGFCGWACWTAMVLDFLPWKISPGRVRNLGIIRYIHFALSFLLMALLFFIVKEYPGKNPVSALYWMIIGNSFYYIISLLIAALLKDNRAFCKYVCPIPVFQKLTSRFSLFKYAVDPKKCINCKICEKSCPMDIKILDYAAENKRVLSSECILCGSCRNSCPRNAIKITKGFDVGIKEKIIFKNTTSKIIKKVE